MGGALLLLVLSVFFVQLSASPDCSCRDPRFNESSLGTPPMFSPEGQPPKTSLVDLQMDGSILTLRCGVTGIPTPTVSWFRFRNDTPIDSTDDGTLSIRVTEAEAPRNGTNYYCVATNRIGSRNTTFAALRSRDVNVSSSFFDDFESVEEREIQVGTIENGDVVLECDFTTSNPAPNITWFAIENMNIMVVEEDTTANNEILYLDGGRYLFIRALTSSERGRLYYCQVNNFLENGVPIRAPTTYSLNTDLENEGITIYRELGTASGSVGDTVQFVYAVAARDVNNTHIGLALLCPENHPFLLFQPTGHIIAVEIKPEASNGDEIDFSCNVFGIGITTFARGTVIVSRPVSPADITYPAPDDLSLTDRKRLAGFGPVQYSCEASGNPAPNITWYYNGAVVQSGSGGVVVNENNTLIISVPLVNHSGIYQCYAQNDFGDDSRTWILEVSEPDVEIGKIDGAVKDRQLGNLIVAESGANVLISLMVNSSSCPTAEPCDPCPKVQWSFNGTNITNDNIQYTISDPCNDSSMCFFYLYELTIHNFNSDNSGIYSATFVVHGSVRSLPMLFVTLRVPGQVLDIDLRVNGSPHRLGECVQQGSNIELICMVTGFPRPEITFMKGEQILTPGQGGVTSPFVDQIFIADIDETAQGMYKCSLASSNEGPGVQVDVCSDGSGDGDGDGKESRGPSLGGILGGIGGALAAVSSILIAVALILYVKKRKRGIEESDGRPLKKKESRVYTDSPQATATVTPAATDSKEAMEMSNVAGVYADPNAIPHETAETGQVYAMSTKKAPKQEEQPPPDAVYSMPDKSKKQKNQELTYAQVETSRPPPPRDGNKHQQLQQDSVLYSDIAHP